MSGEHEHSVDSGLLTRAWWKVRGEVVGAAGLLGDIMADWGVTLCQWSNRHIFTERELEHLTRDVPPEVACVQDNGKAGPRCSGCGVCPRILPPDDGRTS